MGAHAQARDTKGFDAVIRSEFDEMPGMRLTMAQACRLWGLTPERAQAIIRSLVFRGVLSFDDRGRVCRPQDLTH
jgi:hypothetical protein